MVRTEKPLSVTEYLENWESMDSDKKPWLIHFQAVAEIFFTRKMDFTRVIIPGQFLQADVYDNTPQFALHLAASVFVSLLWPDAERSVEIIPSRRLRNVPNIEEYYKFATEEVRAALSQPKAGLDTAVSEFVLDWLAFGTSGLASFDNEDIDEDPEVPMLYDAWGIKNMNVQETAQGFVDRVYYVRPLTVRQIIGEYSRSGDKIPAKIKELYEKSNFSEKFDVLIVLEPKKPENHPVTGERKRGLAGMTYRTVHILKDEKAIMRVGGYEEMPVHVARMYKNLDEVLGRSAAMMALPDGQSLNTITEAILVASEKQLDPPLGMVGANVLGGGVVDTSAGAFNVFDTGGRAGIPEKPVFPLQTVGEFEHAGEQQQSLIDKIMSAFFLDRLLDTKNQVQMTAYETSVRDHKGGQALGSIFTRIYKEGFTPMVERTFNSMFRKGYLGIVNRGVGNRLRILWNKITGAKQVVVPDVVVKAFEAGLDVFEVRYISPAARFMQAEKLRGMLTATDALVGVAGVEPKVMDNIDIDEWTRNLFKWSGSPMDVVRTKEALAKFRAANAADVAKQRDLDDKEKIANIGLKTSQARAQMGTTSSAPPGLVPAGR